MQKNNNKPGCESWSLILNEKQTEDVWEQSRIVGPNRKWQVPGQNWIMENLIICMRDFNALMMETVRTSEKSVYFHETTRRYIP
jgi:hypothetical protein